jgi:two-component system LytT family response regulator
MNIRALIVDDEAPARERIAALLAGEPDVQVVAQCANGPDAVDAIAESQPNLVFLDIQMPEMSGFEVIDAVGAESIPALVFVTAYDAFTLRAFEVRAIDYLLKPFTASRFDEAMRRARRLVMGDAARDLRAEVGRLVREVLPPARDRRIAARAGGNIAFLKCSEIGWIEGAGNYVRLHAGGRVFTMRATLRQVAERLADAGFRRIHHSVIVNFDRVLTIERLERGEHQLTLDDGTRLETSRSYAVNLGDAL